MPESAFVTPPDRAPFEVPGRDPACLLLHGFMGDTREMRPLADALVGRFGCAVYAALWPGHGRPLHTLVGLHLEDFLATGRAAVANIRAQHSTIVVCGYSMGGALAAMLIAEQPAAGFIALAPMITVRQPLLALAPLDALRQMQRRARQAAAHIHGPTLVIQGSYDCILDPAGAAWLYQTLPVADKEFRILPGAGHDLVSRWNLGHYAMIDTILAWMAKRFK
ncbi:MAG: alpha/beta hydrolase [Aggregatilineales bacterium]